MENQRDIKDSSTTSQATEPNSILCLYSGGSDSTVAALMAAKKAKTVYLITYERFGLFSSKRSITNMLRLKKKFPDVEFVYEIVNYEKEYRKVSYGNYISDFGKYKMIPLSVCGLCKLAMHWKTIEMCRKYDVHVVYDGSLKATEIFPAQNKTIMLDALRELYDEHGISYENPVYDMDTQKELVKERIMPSAKVKGTTRDIQPFCSQQLLFVRFVNYYLSKYSFEEYEQKLKEFYSEKVGYVREQLKDAC
jgi:predicted subunit of tRNA(5-methylaminomethyl-2-thiouridylate) methyltransferase